MDICESRMKSQSIIYLLRESEQIYIQFIYWMLGLQDALNMRFVDKQPSNMQGRFIPGESSGAGNSCWLGYKNN